MSMHCFRKSNNPLISIIGIVLLVTIFVSEKTTGDYITACNLYYSVGSLVNKTNNIRPIRLLRELPMESLLDKPDFLNTEPIDEINKALSEDVDNPESPYFAPALHMNAFIMPAIPGQRCLPRNKGNLLRLAYDQYQAAEKQWE